MDALPLEWRCAPGDFKDEGGRLDECGWNTMPVVVVRIRLAFAGGLEAGTFKDLDWHVLLRRLLCREPIAHLAVVVPLLAPSHLLQRLWEEEALPHTQVTPGYCSGLGAWVCDLAWTECAVRARIVRPSVKFRVVPNDTYWALACAAEPEWPGHNWCRTVRTGDIYETWAGWLLCRGAWGELRNFLHALVSFATGEYAGMSGRLSMWEVLHL